MYTRSKIEPEGAASSAAVVSTRIVHWRMRKRPAVKSERGTEKVAAVLRDNTRPGKVT
jgi:hypothetical protein